MKNNAIFSYLVEMSFTPRFDSISVNVIIFYFSLAAWWKGSRCAKKFIENAWWGEFMEETGTKTSQVF